MVDTPASSSPEMLSFHFLAFLASSGLSTYYMKNIRLKRARADTLDSIYDRQRESVRWWSFMV